MRVSFLVTSLLVSVAALGCGGSVPERQDPGVVALEGTLGNTFVQAGQAGEMLARIRVSTTPLPGGARPPINLALVVDTSGSMEGEPIEDAREATLAILDLLREGDRVAVVAFHSTTEVLLPSTVIGGDLNELREKIRQMASHGTTDMAGGLQSGLEQLIANFDPNGVNRVVLLGDGVPNDESGIVAMAQAAGERGIAVTALGLGLDYNETLMGDIARVSGGQFHYIEESTQVATVFREEVIRMQRVFGRNAVVTLQPGPGVTITSVVGQNVNPVGQAVQVHLGDLHEGEARDLIVRANVSARRDGASVELFDAHLAFDDAVVEAGRLERRIFLGAKATADQEQLGRGRNPEIERAAAQVQAAFVTIEAIRIAREGEVQRAREMLQAAEAEARRYQSGDDDDVARQVEQMRSLESALPVAATGSAGGAPSAAPPEPEDDAESPQTEPASEESQRILREVHSGSMDILGF
jgi:Ca-activated chloride channel family protein